MYDVYDFGRMLLDRVRSDAYTAALRAAVTPGCTVLEIGSGTGVFAMLARQWGAATVYAVETADAIKLGPAIAQANGLLDGMEFIHRMSTEVSLPHRVDVLVSDLRGAIPLYEMHLPSIIDARERLLNPEGIQIPLCDTIWGAVVEAPGMYSKLVEPWSTDRFDLDQAIVRDLAINDWRRWRKRDMADARLLTQADSWATIDYTTVTAPHVSGVLDWTIQEPGIAHGMTFWFETTLAEGCEYSTNPDGPELVYGNAFFPLPKPVSVAEGEEVRCSLRADMISGRYVWTWRTSIRSSGVERAAFVQSSFFSSPVDARHVSTQETGFRPCLAKDGRIQFAILGMMDGTRTLEQIADSLRADYPDRFRSMDDALEVARSYSRVFSDWAGD